LAATTHLCHCSQTCSHQPHIRAPTALASGAKLFRLSINTGVTLHPSAVGLAVGRWAPADKAQCANMHMGLISHIHSTAKQ
jgi:hypothetical protein